MKTFILVSLLLLVLGWGSTALAACTAYPLFRIERSKNKNVVQYDVCVSSNGDISDPKPVRVYWILENGQREDLNAIQSKYAYGIESQEQVGENKFSIITAALKNRKIIVEKISNGYKATMTISGKLSILDRIYVKSEERILGLPKVTYIDLFGQTLETNALVNERISP